MYVACREYVGVCVRACGRLEYGMCQVCLCMCLVCVCTLCLADREKLEDEQGRFVRKKGAG